MAISLKLLAGLALAVAISTAAAPALAAGPSICVVHNSADHPSITAMVAGMNDEGAVYGAKITYFDPALDPVKQVSMIEDCISRKPDVIVVNAVDPAAVVPALKKASAAGIPVLMQNADTTDEGHAYTKAFVGSQSYDQGYAVGQMIAKALGGKGNVVVITGKTGQTDTVNRTAGMQAAFKDAKASHRRPRGAARRLEQGQSAHRHAGSADPFPQDRCGASDRTIRWRSARLKPSRHRTARRKSRCSASTATRKPARRSRTGRCTGTASHLSYLVGVYTVRAAYDLTQKPSGADEDPRANGAGHARQCRCLDEPVLVTGYP